MARFGSDGRDRVQRSAAGGPARVGGRGLRFNRRFWAADLFARVLPALALFALVLGAGTASAAGAPGSPAAEPPAATASAPDAATREQIAALTRARNAVVGIETVAVEDATSVKTLGSRRRGSGVLIGADGLVLTIGYLILEADRVNIVLSGDRQVPARVVAYDLATGFGLLQALAPLPDVPAPLGTSRELPADSPLLVASGGAGAALSLARVVSQRPFSGYWEYHIEGALFTAPPRADHSGAGLFNTRGELLGIGSLLVGNALGDGETPVPGNMFVPVDLLKPILAELRERGMSSSSRRAWLGLNCVEYQGAIRVMRVSEGSPAEDAGIAPGDRIVAIDGVAVKDLASFYKALWQREPERQSASNCAAAAAARLCRCSRSTA
jgi:S1-C subfamily serine protease